MSVVENDDANLVRSVLSGNPDDFRKLVDKYQYVAERWAFHHVRNLSDAESVAQEAFVEAYFRLDTLRDPHTFTSWLRSIVINTAISRLRQRRSTVSFEEIVNRYDHTESVERCQRYEVPKPDDLLERQEQEQLLRSAIGSLPATYQIVITMFYFDSCSYKEIAAHMDSSVAAVKSTLHRARQRLRKEMLKNGWRES
jgi:RNA polymerase sigma-70 factor (ECF subfamily)